MGPDNNKMTINLRNRNAGSYTDRICVRVESQGPRKKIHGHSIRLFLLRPPLHAMPVMAVCRVRCAKRRGRCDLERWLSSLTFVASLSTPGMVISRICEFVRLYVCLCVRVLKEERLELSTPILVDIQCTPVARHASTPSLKG